MKFFVLHMVVTVVFLKCLGTSMAGKVCYGKYGCFSTDPPNHRRWPYNKLPESPREVQTTFYLYTREDRIGFLTIDDTDTAKLKKSTYDGTKNTVLIIHGWTGKPLESPWVNEMKQAFLDKEDMNVLIVGWREGASSINYPQPVANSRLVGAQVAQMIKFLNDQTGSTPDTFHIVGFSLGAQVSGYAGKRFQELTYTKTNNTKVGRITGLDPAGPGYEGYDTALRIDSTDGAFVDVIHTDTWPIVGTADKSGHFDFWPNGGKSQPGCPLKKKQEIMRRMQYKKRGLGDKFFKLVGCEHYRAHQYFIESIRATTPKSFVSYRCNSFDDFKRARCTSCAQGCPEMGINAVKYKKLSMGNFYLYTNSKSPYKVAGYAELTFKTGDSMWFAAGHNPRVILWGTKGNTGEFKLSGRLGEGSTEKFVMPVGTDIGGLTHISVKNDQWTYFDKWELIQTSVKYLDSDTVYKACYKMAVKGSFVKKPLTSGTFTCKRKHLIRDHHSKKFRPDGLKNRADNETIPIDLELDVPYDKDSKKSI